MYLKLREKVNIRHIIRSKGFNIMILKRIQTTVGAIAGTNCYVIEDDITKETMVIDPAGETELVVNMLMTIDARLKYIVLTHCHGDHIAGANELREKMGGKILIHRDDEPGLRDPNVNLADYIGLRRNNSRSR